MIAEYNTSGALQRNYIYGPGIDEPICMVSGSNKYYYHYDGLGSVVALSNNSGQVQESYSYDAYGKTTDSSSVGNRFMFTAREYDSETANYFYRARYYSPKLGRFLQTDPIGYYDSMNLYQYCLNNPVNWIDPFGLEKDEAKQHDPFGFIPDKNKRDRFRDWLEDQKKPDGGRGGADNYSKEGLRQKYREWQEQDEPRGPKTKADKPWRKGCNEALKTLINVLPNEQQAKTAQKALLATGGVAIGGAIVVGTGGAAAPYIVPALAF